MGETLPPSRRASPQGTHGRLAGQDGSQRAYHTDRKADAPNSHTLKG